MIARGHVLVVEDEPTLAEILGAYLATDGYTWHWVRSGTQALDVFRQQQPDLVLLDLMLPGKDGIAVFQELRRAAPGVPIIMVTARTDEADRLRGLQLGADDYVCKPFSPREVVARVTGVLRRARPGAPASPLRFLEDGTGVAFDGTEVQFTVAEARLLRLLAGAPGRVFSRAQILDRLHDDDRAVSDRTIDTHVKNIRRRLAEAGVAGDWVKSVYGAGYRMDPPDGGGPAGG